MRALKFLGWADRSREMFSPSIGTGLRPAAFLITWGYRQECWVRRRLDTKVPACCDLTLAVCACQRWTELESLLLRAV
jgi:hypothetical protein